MEDLKNEIDSRFNDIFLLLKKIDSLEKTDIIQEDNILLGIYKSTIYMMLYNIIEYSWSKLLIIIVNVFKNRDIDKFSRQFQAYFVIWFCKNNSSVKVNNMKKKLDTLVSIESERWKKEFSKWILENGVDHLQQRDKFNITDSSIDSDDRVAFKGNIDYNSFFLMSKFFWISLKMTKSFVKDVELILTTIKKNRNLLSHGCVSFSTNWGNKFNTLSDETKKTHNFLKKYIWYVRDYLDSETYLER